MLILGAGYVGAALAARALPAGDEVVLADNWYATDRDQLQPLEDAGAQVKTADVRDEAALRKLLADRFDRVFLLAAQASRPLSEREPRYTEETNLFAPRLVAEAVVAAGRPALLFASSLQVYGSPLAGRVGADRPYGPQGDLAHLSKVYAELCLDMYARRAGLPVVLLRLGIAYGPSPVEHSQPESQTVVEKFRRLAAAGEELPLDDGGRATIGIVHVEDVARIMLEAPAGPGISRANVAAETVTVADVAALARGGSPEGRPAWTVASPFRYEHRLAEYLPGAP